MPDPIRVTDMLDMIWGATPAGSKTVKVPKDLFADAMELLRRCRPVKAEFRPETEVFKARIKCGMCDSTIATVNNTISQTVIPNFCPYCGQFLTKPDRG